MSWPEVRPSVAQILQRGSLGCAGAGRQAAAIGRAGGARAGRAARVPLGRLARLPVALINGWMNSIHREFARSALLRLDFSVAPSLQLAPCALDL